MKRCSNCKNSFLHYSYVMKFSGLDYAVAHGRHCSVNGAKVENKHVCGLHEFVKKDNANGNDQTTD